MSEVTEIMERVSMLDAQEFEDLVRAMSRMAADTWFETRTTAFPDGDDGWAEAASHLRAAAKCVGERSGN